MSKRGAVHEDDKFEKYFVNSPRRGQRVAKHAEKMLGLIGFEPGQKHLDFGCGTGAAANYLTSKLGLDVTGIDVDPEQISAAQAASRNNQKVRVLVVDGARLPFSDNEFDFVATHMVTHHIPDWEDSLSQMLRLLEPDGHLIYKDFALPKWFASRGKKLSKSLGYLTADDLHRFARENHLVAVHLARSFNKYEVVWRKDVSDGLVRNGHDLGERLRTNSSIGQGQMQHRRFALFAFRALDPTSR